MSYLFQSRAAVLEYEAKQRLVEKEIELERLKAQRQPLTDEQILAHWAGDGQRMLRPVLGSKKVLAFARAIEAAVKREAK